MTYVYIANAVIDRPFAERLSSDLKRAEVPHWYDDGQATDQQVFAQLKKSSHMVVVLSPAVLTDERMLGALEGGKQFQLERIALRRAPMESLPPQIQGILPLNAVDDEAYAKSLDTLLHDLNITTSEPEPELPQSILTALNSENAAMRRSAIEELSTYRDRDEAERNLALDTLNMATFRERDSSLKDLLRAITQSFNIEVSSLPEPVLPSKEELREQAGEDAVMVEAEEILYFWRSSRWHLIWVVLGLIISGIAFVAGGHWAYLIPVMLVVLSLPHLNIIIRKNGEFDWEMPGPIFGNLLLGVMIGGGSALVLMLGVEALDAAYLVVNSILAIVLGLAIGWLSAVETAADSQ
jgi:hypothetical protein